MSRVDESDLGRPRPVLRPAGSRHQEGEGGDGAGAGGAREHSRQDPERGLEVGSVQDH